MCNETNNPFADLEDTEYWDSVDTSSTPDDGEPNVTLYEENCPKCGGTGAWRPGYKCFKCKGKGKLTFKTNAAQRKHARQKSRERKAKKAEQNYESGLASLDPDVREWLQEKAKSESDSFAISLLTNIVKYGSLTEKQVAAVRNAIARDADKQAGFAEWCKQFDQDVLGWLQAEVEAGNEFAGSLLDAGNKFGSLTERQLACVLRNIDENKSSDDPASQLDISSLTGYYAVPGGDTRLKICVRRPGKNSRWHGWTFVDDGAAYGSRQTYGKQAPDGTYKGRIVEQLQAILENPLEAQQAYGKLTGTCGYCGRILEDPESIERGIGPVCASKYE